MHSSSMLNVDMPHHEVTLQNMHALITTLFTQRKSAPDSWKSFCADFREDPRWHLIRKDPFTRHSQDQPRGYPGDAGLIDIIYSQEAHFDCDIGKSIFAYTVNAPSCRAVRYRREYFAQAINAVAGKKSGARILSMACGYLREALECEALNNGAVAEFIAMDQDEVSLKEVASSCSHLAVTPVQGTVNDWIRQRPNYRNMDLVYAAGLYDYLNDKLATRLTARLFESLGTGGQLILPNFLPDVQDVGYMECCMDWWLIYRDQKGMEILLAEIPPSQIANVSYHTEPNNNIIFMTVERA